MRVPRLPQPGDPGNTRGKPRLRPGVASMPAAKTASPGRSPAEVCPQESPRSPVALCTVAMHAASIQFPSPHPPAQNSQGHYAAPPERTASTRNWSSNASELQERLGQEDDQRHRKARAQGREEDAPRRRSRDGSGTRWRPRPRRWPSAPPRRSRGPAPASRARPISMTSARPTSGPTTSRAPTARPRSTGARTSLTQAIWAPSVIRASGT